MDYPPESTTCAFVVISCWEETPYRGEHSAWPRHGLSFTIHPDEAEALARAEIEAEFCLVPSQISTQRRCAVMEVTVSQRLVGHDGTLHFWVSDRIVELARRACLIRPLSFITMVQAAFEVAREGKPHRLAFLQSANAAQQQKGGEALFMMLKTLSAMPAEAARTLEAGVRALLPPPTAAVSTTSPSRDLPEDNSKDTSEVSDGFDKVMAMAMADLEENRDDFHESKVD